MVWKSVLKPMTFEKITLTKVVYFKVNMWLIWKKKPSQIQIKNCKNHPSGGEKFFKIQPELVNLFRIFRFMVFVNKRMKPSKLPICKISRGKLSIPPPLPMRSCKLRKQRSLNEFFMSMNRGFVKMPNE